MHSSLARSTEYMLMCEYHSKVSSHDNSVFEGNISLDV
eukprot:CAMPEP_0172621234 /NCGR_PEP_ID=MMETSP1068-20121228/110458_1 /TAXON_ID=35684 /ORGANISM="Pseudopedinella elastica, Strain CCMP716" /LENGTH=37 /DNA_ID= /DNA_START= /DNA_END= /DNA_ORIENTATION=